MRSILALVACLALAKGAAASNGIAVDMETAHENCKSEWPSDFRMQEYCIGVQEQAAATLANREFNLPDEHSEAITTACVTDWPDDAQMILYCMETQETAAARLRTPLTELGVEANAATLIEAECAAQWLSDMQMIDYCRTTQADAWKRLNN